MRMGYYRGPGPCARGLEAVRMGWCVLVPVAPWVARAHGVLGARGHGVASEGQSCSSWSLRDSWIRGCSDSRTIPSAGLQDYEDTRLKTSSRVRKVLSLAWKAS